MGTQFETVSDIPANYMLVYHDTEIQLVRFQSRNVDRSALVFGALGFTQRRRFRRRLTS